MDYVKRQSERAWCHIVHRLDRDTSGVMVFAKNQKIKERLQIQFAQRDVERVYHALVEGGPKNSEGIDSSWLVEDKHLHVKRVKSTFKGSKESITHWRVEDQDEFVSLIEIKILNISFFNLSLSFLFLKDILIRYIDQMFLIS